MKVKLALLLAVLALMSIAALAQSGVAGKWVGELSAKDGHGVSQPITIELKMEGEVLSGTVTEGALDARPIQGASIDGAMVTFRTVRNFGGADINVNWKGELKGDDLALTREIGPAPAEAAGGRGGGRGGAGGGGGGGGRGGGGRGGAAPAAGAQRGAAADVPPVPNPDQAGAAADAGAARGGGARGAAAGAAGGGGRGGAGRGGGAPAAAAAPPGPTVALTLHRSR